jgi:predicted transcriptional regulator
MRHVTIPNYTVDHPYQGSVWGYGPYHTYNFSSPTKDRVYVKVLKFVEKHPGCKRSDIQFGVWGNHKKSNSTLFAQMLYHDILDYNSKFEYKVTRKGKSLLKKVAKAK